MPSADKKQSPIKEPPAPQRPEKEPPDHFVEHAQNALYAHAAVHTAAFVDVVGGDPEVAHES